MTPREWIDNLDDTDRKGMAAWGIVLGIAVLGSLVPAIGWVFCLLIGLFWFLFIWGIGLYGWLGWLLPERKVHASIREVPYSRAQTRATFTPVREQQQARPIPVPELGKVISLHRPET